tara:strand:+ start:68 stop:730 length:663 start_codon:yes stop_codon:yes gene_type:complete
MFEGKKIILVGNSVEILNYKYGKIIDSYDTIIRMGRGIPNPNGVEDNTQAIGTKTHVWVTGFLRENMSKEKHIKKVPLKLLNRTRMYMKSPREPNYLKDFTTMFTDNQILEIYDEFGFKNTNDKSDPQYGRPSNGFITLLWLTRKCSYHSITLIGFDFFAKYYPINVGKAKPQSWHLPHNTHTSTPHRSEIERDYALKLYGEGVIKWIILSNLKEEVLDF